jgi:alkanesulfonate monooxygenase SsuD/methylene tetrahydromethanopterin reductase-like flavin-dependent oxidoreductase (luciferase family)
MAELAPGRVALGIGPWWEPAAHRHGASRRRPVTAMRDAATIIKHLLAGETVDYRGGVFQAHDLERSAANVPVVFGVDGPQLTRLAGECADGLLVNYGTSAGGLAAKLVVLRDGAASAGRDPDDVRVRVLVWCAPGDDLPVRHVLLRRPDLLAAAGMDAEAATALADLAATADAAARDRLAARVPDAAVHSFAVTGPEPEVRAGIQRFRDAGADTVVLVPLGDPIACLQSVIGG